MRPYHRLVMLLLVLPLGQACGNNVFAPTEKSDPAEDAVLALEAHDETEAIAILDGALEGDGGNTKLLSILATAYAQRAGIDPIEFARNVGESGSDDGGSGASGGGLTSMFGLVPDVTTRNLADIERACEILIVDIPAESRTRTDVFKLALYQTAAVVMRTKALDLDGDGTLELDEITNLSSTSATGLLSQLAQASSLFASGGAEDASSEAAGKTINDVQAGIAASPGDNDEERLRNYLAGAR